MFFGTCSSYTGHCVNLNNTKSTICRIHLGVPHGSIMGSVLHNIYIKMFLQHMKPRLSYLQAIQASLLGQNNHHRLILPDCTQYT